MRASFDADAAVVADGAQICKKRYVRGALCRIARKRPGVALVGEMQMYEPVFHLAQNYGVFVFRSEVIKIADDVDLGMVRIDGELIGFGRRIDDIRFLMAQRFDADHEPVILLYDFVAHATKKILQLRPGLFARESFGNLPRSATAKDHDLRAKRVCPRQRFLHIVIQRGTIDRRADNFHLARNKRVHRFDAAGGGGDFRPDRLEIRIAERHRPDYGRLAIIETHLGERGAVLQNVKVAALRNAIAKMKSAARLGWWNGIRQSAQGESGSCESGTERASEKFAAVDHLHVTEYSPKRDLIEAFCDRLRRGSTSPLYSRIAAYNQGRGRIGRRSCLAAR